MIKGYICPDGEKINKDDCLNSCRMEERCETRSFLRKVAQDRPWTGKPSTTQLLNGTCESYLRVTVDYYVDPERTAFAILGTNTHATLEENGEVVEQHLELDGTTGIPDELDEDIVYDYKTSGSYKVMLCLGIHVKKEDIPTGAFYKNGKPKTKVKTTFTQVNPDYGEYLFQLNRYRMMYEAKGETVKAMKISFIVRDGGTYMAFNRGIMKNTYMCDIPKVDDEILKEYFNRKRDNLIYALENDEYPERCNSDETWTGRKCLDYCPVREVCKYNLNKG